MKNRVMKTGLVMLALMTCILLAYCNKQGDQANQQATDATANQTAPSPADMVKRGEYLVTIGGCNDCHTPKIWGASPIPDLDTARLLSGHRADITMPAVGADCLSMKGWVAASNADFTTWTGPWGTSFTANLTPDEATGLGTWTETMFIETIRNGKHMGSGRDILPPMPWPNIRMMTDDDLRAVFAYLQSIKPVSNQVPQPIPPAGAPGGTGETQAH